MTLKDVAARAAVPVSTVSLVLNSQDARRAAVELLGRRDRPTATTP
ncbi:LacI family DNA-binding transcriptional regulator [Nonomuraea basaltis]|nr:LacI family DNA-binding transcriptional regulator [Nonomuraea basaltis]